MFRILLIILLIYLLWQLIKPYIAKIVRKPDIKGKENNISFHVDEDQIEDAQYKEIDDSNKKDK
jgi:hypothetical protein